jgi:hypothetical protein
MSEQIEPGDGWRLLGPDEVIKDGDEVYIKGDWFGTLDAGLVVADYIYRRRIPAKPEAMDIWNAFEVSVGSGVAANFVIRQIGAGEYEWDVVIGDAVEARQLADWLTRYADWREAQEGESK